jgi:hypothetical protein
VAKLTKTTEKIWLVATYLESNYIVQLAIQARTLQELMTKNEQNLSTNRQTFKI